MIVKSLYFAFDPFYPSYPSFDPFYPSLLPFGTTQTSVTLYTRTSVTLAKSIARLVLRSRFVMVALSPSLRGGRPRRGAAKQQGRSEAKDSAGRDLYFTFFISALPLLVLCQA